MAMTSKTPPRPASGGGSPPKSALKGSNSDKGRNSPTGTPGRNSPTEDGRVRESIPIPSSASEEQKEEEDQTGLKDEESFATPAIVVTEVQTPKSDSGSLNEHRQKPTPTLPKLVEGQVEAPDFLASLQQRRGSKEHGGNTNMAARHRTKEKAKVKAKGDLRYQLVDVEPPSPRMVISDRRRQQWQARINSSSSRRSAPQPDDAIALPAMDWFAEELLKCCGRALLPAPGRLLALQVRHTAAPKILKDAQHLWPFLWEVATTFSAAAYHVQRAHGVLVREVDKLVISRTSQVAVAAHTRSRSSLGGFDAGPPMQLPKPPFEPKTADAALAELHQSVCKLQNMGPQLSAILLRFAQGIGSDPFSNVQRLLSITPLRGNTGSFGEFHFIPSASISPEYEEIKQTRLQRLLLVVPCVEEALDRLGTLLNLFDRLQASKASGQDQKINTRRSVQVIEFVVPDDQDDDEEPIDSIPEEGPGATNEADADDPAEDSQELVEEPAMPEAPEPSEKARSRPSSATRHRGTVLRFAGLEDSAREEESAANDVATLAPSQENAATATASALGRASSPADSGKRDREHKEEKAEKKTKGKTKKKRG